MSHGGFYSTRSKETSRLRRLDRIHSVLDPVPLAIYNKIVAWWERDEASGLTMTDAHTNALHGTYSGLTVNQAGLATNLNKSVSFPSGNNYAEVPDNSLLKITGNLACMVWVKPTGTQGNFPKLLWKPNNNKAGGQANYLLTQDNFNAGGKAQFRVTVGGSNYTVQNNTVLASGSVYHLVGNRNAGQLDIWTNGVKDGTFASSIGTSLLDTAADSLRWGYHGSSGDPFVGDQDQSAVFNSHLTDAEIAYLYNGGAGISYAALKTAAGL